MVIMLKMYNKRKEELEEKGLLVKDITPAHRKIRLMNVSDNVTIYRFGWGRDTEKYSLRPKEYRKEMEDKEMAAQQEMARRATNKTAEESEDMSNKPNDY